MKKNFSIRDLLLPYAVIGVGLFVLYDIRYHFFLIYIMTISAILVAGIRLKDINISTLAILVAIPFSLEVIVFSSGLISLSSTESSRLLQNSIIFGVHFLINLSVVFPLTHRVELTKKLFPKAKVRFTFADSILPWLAILGVFMSFAGLVENYLRHAKGVNSTIFFYSFDVSGYIIYASNCGVLLVLTALTYKEEYDYALPSLRKKR
ncbi:hypothetical protein [Pseudoalteromonas maricaloris]